LPRKKIQKAKYNFIIILDFFLKTLRPKSLHLDNLFNYLNILFEEKDKKKNFKKYFYLGIEFFQESFLLISEVLKSKFPKVRLDKKENLVRKKIFNMINIFREIETDFLILKQTFNEFERKKENFIFHSLEKISKKFNHLCEKIFKGGRGSVVIHYKNCFDPFSKKKFFKKINGVSILLKSKKEESVAFCDQVSSGQASLVFGLLLISFREIIKVKIYVLDEFDSNLDPNFLKIFSYLLKQLSSLQIQFFISTYKKNFLAIGDKWFGVSFHSKSSYIQNISKKNAMKFASKTFL
jgi:structural maintenance of chromosome 3 (chondroitin sulfate proteoglycan 6)